MPPSQRRHGFLATIAGRDETGTLQLFRADVCVAALLGEFDLLATLFEAGFAIFVEVADTFRARDALTIVR